jgi:biopolymer transport protein ExbD
VSVSFECPHCRHLQTAARSLIGRRVRCPECDLLLDLDESVLRETSDQPERDDADADITSASEDARGTVSLLPPDDEAAGDTVQLEAVDVHEALDQMEPLDVEEAIDEPLPPPQVPKKEPEPEEEAEAEGPLVKIREREETEMDMTPMVDVTFLLLIFFMVTAAFSLQKSIEVPTPSSEEASTNAIPQDPQDNSDFVTVRVDEFNTYTVLTVDWEEEAPSVQDLHIHLRRARDGDSTGTVPTKLLVEAHGDALHGRVVAALDAGTATGFEEVQLTTVDEES